MTTRKWVVVEWQEAKGDCVGWPRKSGQHSDTWGRNSEFEAIDVAERMAKDHPGKQFAVMLLLGVAQTNEQVYTPWGIR